MAETNNALIDELVDVVNATVTECSRVMGDLDRKCNEIAKNQRKLEHEFHHRVSSLESLIHQQNERISDLSLELTTLRESAANIGAVQTWVRETEARHKTAVKKLTQHIETRLNLHSQQIDAQLAAFAEESAGMSVSSGAVSVTPSVNQALLEDLATRCSRLLHTTRHHTIHH